MTESGKVSRDSAQILPGSRLSSSFQVYNRREITRKNIRPAPQPVRTSPDISLDHGIMGRGVLGVDLRILRQVNNRAYRHEAGAQKCRKTPGSAVKADDINRISALVDQISCSYRFLQLSGRLSGISGLGGTEQLFAQMLKHNFTGIDSTLECCRIIQRESGMRFPRHRNRVKARNR